MGLFIGTSKRYLADNIIINKTFGDKLKLLRSFAITISDTKINFPSFRCHTSNVIDHNFYNILYAENDYHVSHHYNFEYTDDDDFIKIINNKLLYETCELLALVDFHEPNNAYAVGLLIELPNLTNVKKKYRCDTLLSLYMNLKYVLCDDVIIMIFKKCIYFSIYGYYSDVYCNMIVQQPYPTEDCKQLTINRRIKIFDNCFKLWFDQHVNL